MRIVDNLKEITRCPNCGGRELMSVENHTNFTKSLFCYDCHEEICEETSTFLIGDRVVTSQQEKEEMEFFELRELIDSLRYHVSTVHEEGIITCLQTILNKMTDIIERKEQ
jgi:hypothetical protein